MMDFITLLPYISCGFDSLYVFVDHSSKYKCFVPFRELISAPKLAKLFLLTGIAYCGMPSCLISDHDLYFLSLFFIGISFYSWMQSSVVNCLSSPKKIGVLALLVLEIVALILCGTKLVWLRSFVASLHTTLLVVWVLVLPSSCTLWMQSSFTIRACC